MAAFSVSDIERMLPINKHRLDDELEIQSEMMFRISEQLRIANSKMLDAKNQLSKFEADLRIRLITGDDENKAVSDVKAQMMVAADPERDSFFRKFQEARSQHEQWLGLLSAWQSRGYSIKTLADLHLGDYYAVDSAGREEAGKTYSEHRKLLAKSRLETASQHPEPDQTKAPARRRVVEE